MDQSRRHRERTIDQIISQRTGIGPNPMIEGRQAMLRKFLAQMTPYLRPPTVVTFQQLTGEEQQVFHCIAEQVSPPASTWGIYLPPSVRNQMLHTNPGVSVPHTATVPADDGVILLSRTDSHNTLINVLLAHRPHVPAIDVYQKGAMIAGYVFKSEDECLASISDAAATLLGHAGEDAETEIDVPDAKRKN